MSIDQKQQIANIFTWALRILTAIGGFFLIQTYGLLKDNNAMMQQHLIQYASDKTRWDVRLQVHDEELRRLREERQQRMYNYKPNP